MRKIVIIGAGYAGILTAKKLAKKVKKQKIKDVEITIIDRNPFHTMLTELHEVAAGRVDENSIKISLKKVFAGRKVNVKLDTVNKIDFNGKQVICNETTYDYDYLVIAAGSKPTFYDIEGVEEHAFKLWSYEDAILLKEHIFNTFHEASKEADLEERKKLLTFYVIGAGFTGIEMIGELAEYVPFLCKKYEIKRDEVKMVCVDGLNRPVPNMPEKISAKVEKRLRKMGVEFRLNTCLTKVCEETIGLRVDGKEVIKAAHTIIWGAGTQSSDITMRAADSLEKQKGGRIQVDQYLRSTKDEKVYVIGDNMFYVPKGEKEPVPQMVENCEQSSSVAAKNILCELKNKGEMQSYKPVFHGVMVSIGGRYGVAYVGFKGHFFSLASFIAMFSKHFINVIYFIQVLGWNKVFSYIKHEFFTIRNSRSFVGGHFSNRTPSFLLFPLRVFLGAVWVFEGVMKILEGWLKQPKLQAFFGGAQGWYNSIINPMASSVDVTSAATSIAETVGAESTAAGTLIFNWNIIGLFKMIFVSGSEISTSTISDFAFKLDIPIMNWFIDGFILPNNKVQLAMQIFIVVAEILIGLALIGGLFSSPAAAFSLVLQFMFVSTTGLYLSTFWMVFAAITLLIGAGRTFGLDYYVMPALKKLWKKIPIVRKSYLYHD